MKKFAAILTTIFLAGCFGGPDLPKENGERMDLARETKDVEILKVLAKDKNQGVRANVGANQLTPVALLQKLADDSSATVQKYVASNLSAPQEILEELSTREDPKIRWVVATNPTTKK